MSSSSDRKDQSDACNRVSVGWLVFDGTFSGPFRGTCVGSSCD